MSVNTVDALITLGKSLIGLDYAPPLNATDAEVIDSVSNELVANGISAGTNVEPRIIQVEQASNDTWSSNTDTGLTIDDFINVPTFIEMVHGSPEPYQLSFAKINVLGADDDTCVMLVCMSPSATGEMLPFYYYPSSGYITTSEE